MSDARSDAIETGQVLPPYLHEVALEDVGLGTLHFDEKHEQYVIDAKPFILDMVRRIFPAARNHEPRKESDGLFGEDFDAEVWNKPRSKPLKGLRVAATPRNAGEINWLLQRYPLHVACRDVLDRHLHRARRHFERIRDIPRISTPKGFNGTLKHFQEHSVGFLVGMERGLCADEMGLGKTVTALAGLCKTQALPALIVVEPAVQLQWQKMIGQWIDIEVPKDPYTLDVGLEVGDPGQRMSHILQGLTPYKLPNVPIYIVHYGLLRGWSDALQDVGFRTVILDEVQSLRNHTTAKYRAIKPVLRGADYVWGLSGTPIYNYGGEIWSVFDAIDEGCLDDRSTFVNTWCDWGSHVKDPAALGDYLRRIGLMIRHRADDVMDELPQKRRISHAIGNDADQYAKLMKRAQSLAASLDTIKRAERGVAMLEIENEARRATGVAKAAYAAAFIASLLEADERVVVWAHHHDVHDILLEELKEYQPAAHTGRQTMAEKATSVRRFQHGETNLFIGGLRTAAGIDGLQDRGTCTVFVELDWTPAIHAQAEDRLKRIGSQQRQSIPCYYLVSATPIDEHMQEVLGLKIGQFVGVMADPEETPEDQELAQKAGRDHLRRVVERITGEPLRDDEEDEADA